jgi:hypothetical protein
MAKEGSLVSEHFGNTWRTSQQVPEKLPAIGIPYHLIFSGKNL